VGVGARTLLYEYLSQFSRTKLHAALSAAFTGQKFAGCIFPSLFSLANLFFAPFLRRSKLLRLLVESFAVFYF